MNKQQLISDLNQVTASALNPNRLFTVRLEPELHNLRRSLILCLHKLCSKRIEGDDDDGAEDVINAISCLTDDEGFYTFEVIFTEQASEVTASYHRIATVTVKIFANDEDGEYDEYEFDHEDGEVYQLHLQYAGYPESGVITGNIFE